LHKKNPELKEKISEQQQAIFNQGHNVGELAQQLFPGGIDASPESYYEFQKSVALTAELIKAGKTIIFEAAFQYEKVLCAIDILVKKNGKWFAYEVKSSTSIKDQFIHDAAFQYYVINKTGVELADLSVIYINNEYVRYGELDIQQLFKTESILGKALVLQPAIDKKIAELKATLKLTTPPDITIGNQCHSPYTCDFISYCWRDVPENSVFDLRGKGASTAANELYGQGIVEISKIPEDYKLSEHLRAQVNSQTNNETIIDKECIKEFLAGLVYPLYYLDFETYATAIPEYDCTWAYEQIPFQFSLHIQKTKDGVVEHLEFLAEAGKDTREDFIIALIKAVGTEGSVVAYNKGFEGRIMKEMAAIYPKYNDELQAIIGRLYDLMTPFQKKMYYKPEMSGSYSIKDVLPALVPELSYTDLPINNGAAASIIFCNLKFEKDQVKVQEIRNDLLQYCKLDTLAMVKILEVLEKLV
jgi:hypothetical protein